MLRDQRIIAGIGNAYSDEVLHAANMSPFKIAASMTPDDVAVLYDAIKTTLHEAVKRSAGLAATDLKGEKKSGLRVHGKTGQACAVCGDTPGGLVRRLRAPVLPTCRPAASPSPTAACPACSSRTFPLTPNDAGCPGALHSEDQVLTG